MHRHPVNQAPVLAAEALADQLRSHVLGGGVAPGQRLDEVTLCAHLAVSRNTLREAFRLLSHEGLVEHRTHRGVFVATIDAPQARHVYAVRRQLELGALDELMARRTSPAQPWSPAEEAALQQMRGQLELAREAQACDEWMAVGTANAAFHLALGSLGGNPVAERLLAVLVGQTRLRLLALGNPQAIHQGFVDDNERITLLLEDGQVGRARAVLESYLLRAETLLARD
ncbi:GntR family transcriptional regulator [Luteococcus sediminum]